MADRVRWRPVLAALLGAVAVAATVQGGLQLSRAVEPPAVVSPPGAALPGSAGADLPVAPLQAVAGPPVVPPSAVVPTPAPPLGPSATPPAPRRSGSAHPSHRPDAQTSGESQYEYGCRRGYITRGC